MHVIVHETTPVGDHLDELGARDGGGHRVTESLAIIDPPGLEAETARHGAEQ